MCTWGQNCKKNTSLGRIFSLQNVSSDLGPNNELTLPLDGLLRDRPQQAERVDARLGYELWVGRGAGFLVHNFACHFWHGAAAI